MSNSVQVNLPDIGNLEEAKVTKVWVAPGDRVAAQDTLITLEGAQSPVPVPSPQAGLVKSVAVKVGDKIAAGGAILELELEAGGDLTAEVLVLGAGPGGYTAAFRAADLGKKVVLIERYPDLGGVCLNVGCIPSKALLHTAEVIHDAAHLGAMGVSFGPPQIDLDAMRAGKEKVVKRLTQGLAALAKQRKIQVVRGVGRFESPNRLAVTSPAGRVTVTFDHAIIACGSSPVRIPGFPHEDPRLMDSTDALALAEVPKRMLVVGGGIIGLEMASVYSALGSQIDIVELMPQLIPGCDPDLVKVLHRQVAKQYRRIMTETKVTEIKAQQDGLRVSFAGAQAPDGPQLYDRVLVAVGRSPNGRHIGAEQAGVKVDERGFIPVDGHMRTNVPNIYAIGDVVGNPMLAHKATHEAKVAAEVIAGHLALFDPLAIPSVAYTDPEIAWMGLTETEAKAKGIPYEKGAFPWAASGRALGIGREEGFTKLLVDPDTHRVLGAGIVGRHAGELIAEAVLALELGADTEDLGLTIHPHPTLSETLCFAAEMVEGSITDLVPPKKRA